MTYSQRIYGRCRVNNILYESKVYMVAINIKFKNLNKGKMITGIPVDFIV